MTSVLKNTLDWLWRAGAGSDSAFSGLATLIISGSKHLHAGLRAAEHARSTLSSLGCMVLPEQGAMAFAQRHFHPDDGQICDAVLVRQLDQLADSLAAIARLGRSPVIGRSPWLDSLEPSELEN
jgi:NAD(P)H-dependent FMN reductase